jgi:hypothetical protein
VSGTHPAPNPRLADHRMFAAYRWLTWCVTTIWLLGQGQLNAYAAVLAVTLLLTLFSSVLAYRYVHLARQLPAIMGLDILLAVAVVMYSGGWESPFAFYALGSLVLPALLFGWIGGVMAGLLLVAANQTMLMVSGTPAAERLFGSDLARLSVPLALVVPPVFGGLFALLVDRIRQQGSGQRNWRDPDDDPTFDAPLARAPRQEAPRASPPRGERRGDAQPDAPLTTQLIRTRVEPSVEELRRVLFAPLPAPSMDLGAALDVLMTRFGQQTGLTARVSVIGRNRLVRPISIDLLMRLAQEGLINVQQHAHASSASLTLRYDINSVMLLIQDDGIGLVDGTYERPGLHSLRAMQYRVAEFGGRLDVFETEGGGVTVRATMPLE